MKDTGNKKFTIYSVKIGVSKSTVKSMMKKQTNVFTVKCGKTYRRGEAGYIVFTYKNGILSKWLYIIADELRLGVFCGKIHIV